MSQWMIALVLFACRGHEPPSVPGIHEADRYPQGCVDCHHENKGGEDYRILVQLELSLDSPRDDFPLWREGATAAAPPGVTMTGKHPDVLDQMKVIPTDCFTCHAKDSTVAPPFARLMHLYHLRMGDEPNPYYFSKYDGWCTHCHALDFETGKWRVKSGPANGR